MRILTVLTYYTPHTSGLTVYTRRLVRRLVAGGHEVTVLTSHYSRELPPREVVDGATVVRSPVLAKVSKWVLMPLFPWQVARLIASHDVLYIHLPQVEASWAALWGRLLRKPVVMTYHCDIELPPGFVRLICTPVIRLAHYVAGKLSDRIVVNTAEFGREARLPAHFHDKVVSVYPPVELKEVGGDGRALRERHDLGDGPIVGFVGRFAEEKGIDYLIGSVPLVLREVPGARFVLAGLTDTVPGERAHEKLRPKIEALGSDFVHLGLLTDEELTAFYQTMDVLVLPSVNSTESFGMTQAEAMLAGTPVVASDIPGVREAVRVTGMGELVPPRDEQALARAIVAVLQERDSYVRPANEIRALFDSRKTAAFYEELFAQLVTSRSGVLSR